MIILLKIKQFLKMSDNEEDFFCGERSAKENIIIAISKKERLTPSHFRPNIKSVHAKIVKGEIFSDGGEEYCLNFDTTATQTCMYFKNACNLKKEFGLVSSEGDGWAGWDEKNQVYLNYSDSIQNNEYCMKILEITGFEFEELEELQPIKNSLELQMYTILSEEISKRDQSFDEILESSDFIQDFINTLKIQEQPIHKTQEPSIHKIQEPTIHKTPLYFLIEKYPDDVESIIKREKTFSREELEACIKKSEKDNLRYEKAMSIFTKSHTAFVFKKTNAYIYFCKEIKTFSKHSKNLWKDVDQKMYKSFLSHNATLFKNIYLQA